jgi:outer membrane protein, protease secretion system
VPINMNRLTLTCAVALALSGLASHSHATSLIEAYEAALQNDPTYRSAMHEREAGAQYKVLGRSNLLPQVSASHSQFKNRAEVTQPNFVGQLQTSNPQYDSKSSAIQLRQPLVNFDGVARYKQGIAQSNYSEALFESRGRELLIRLVGAYADAKFSEDQLALAVAQRDTLAEQKQVNDQMFRKGEGTRTDMLETQARFDVAEAQVLEARDAVMTARNNLTAITGGEITQLDALKDMFAVTPLSPSSFEEWKTIALDRNSDLVAQRYSIEAAKEEVNKARAGHAPRIDFVASYSKGLSESITTLNQDTTNRTIGVQVTIPIYSGGSVSASSAQAVSGFEKSKSDLDAKTAQLLVELRKQYNAVLSSAAKIAATEKAVNSARLLVQATQQSVKGGVRINLDVLNAQQQLYVAQRDYAQARYTYLISYLKLKSAAGTLNQDDVHTVAGYFVASK